LRQLRRRGRARFRRGRQPPGRTRPSVAGAKWTPAPRRQDGSDLQMARPAQLSRPPPERRPRAEGAKRTLGLALAPRYSAFGPAGAAIPRTARKEHEPRTEAEGALPRFAGHWLHHGRSCSHQPGQCCDEAAVLVVYETGGRFSPGADGSVCIARSGTPTWAVRSSGSTVRYWWHSTSCAEPAEPSPSCRTRTSMTSTLFQTAPASARRAIPRRPPPLRRGGR
jgi:hypothetical protein